MPVQGFVTIGHKSCDWASPLPVVDRDVSSVPSFVGFTYLWCRRSRRRFGSRPCPLLLLLLLLLLHGVDGWHALPLFHNHQRCKMMGFIQWPLFLVEVSCCLFWAVGLKGRKHTLSMGYKRHFYKRQNEQLVENSEKIRDRTSWVFWP